MTDLVEPSFNSVARNRTVAGAVAFAGGVGNGGWIQPSSSRLVEDPEGNLAAGALNAFDESSDSSTLDVTIDTGEALIEGAYIARDTTTDFTLAANQTLSGVDIYVGWRDGAEDTVIIGRDGDFTADDHRILAWTFTTDGVGVTGATDHRPLSYGAAFVDHAASDIDASSFNGGSGSAGEVLETDGTSTTWSDKSPAISDPTDVSASRSTGTWYQNTSGNPLLIFITVQGSQATINLDLHANSTQTNNVLAHGNNKDAGSTEQKEAFASLAVPDTWYYKAEGNAVLYWTETDLQTAQ